MSRNRVRSTQCPTACLLSRKRLPLNECRRLSSSSTSFFSLLGSISRIHFRRWTLSVFMLLVSEKDSGTVTRPVQLAAVGGAARRSKQSSNPNSFHMLLIWRLMCFVVRSLTVLVCSLSVHVRCGQKPISSLWHRRIVLGTAWRCRSRCSVANSGDGARLHATDNGAPEVISLSCVFNNDELCWL